MICILHADYRYVTFMLQRYLHALVCVQPADRQGGEVIEKITDFIGAFFNDTMNLSEKWSNLGEGSILIISKPWSGLRIEPWAAMF